MYAKDVLLRTAALIQDGLVIAAPEDVATAIEKVYGGDQAEFASDRWRALYERAVSVESVKTARQEDLAEDSSIPPADGSDFLTFLPCRLDEHDPDARSQIAARTRLEDLPSVELVLIRSGDERLLSPRTKEDKKAIALATVRTPAGGIRYAELAALATPPGWRLAGGLRHLKPVILRDEGSFETGSFRYTYDPEHGLSWRRIDG